MSKNTGLNLIKVMSLVFGYFVALSLVRGVSTPFNWYFQRNFGTFAAWFNFGLGLSVLLIAVCVGLFAFSILATKQNAINFTYKKFDFSVLGLVCVVGVYAAFLTIQVNPTAFNLAFLSATSYFLAMFIFGELLARIRDKTLLTSLYWISFFKTYPMWQPMGFFALLLIASQLYLLVYYFTTPIRLFALFTITSLTYFAAFLVSMGEQYTQANADKIRAERFKSELITNVSHDIKTPLTSIISYLDLLKSEDLQGKPAEYVEVLNKKSARLKTLIDDLMEASKAGTGNMRVDLQEINLLEIVGQVAGEFEDRFNDNGLTLVLRQPDDPVLFNTDSRHLYRVLENLFSNISKYALGGTRIFVEVTLHDNRPHIVMQNTSAAPVDFSDGEATEQFIRGDKSRQTEGSGLGLYIAKSLVELMEGRFHINVIGDLFRVDIFL
jgi:signal transduction histidine kinase